MPRFDFRSPGADATAAIQDFTRQRNLDERQALLDALQQRQVEHGMKIDDANLAIAQAGNTRAGELHSEDMFTRKRGNLGYGEVEQSNIDPSLWTELEKRGLTAIRPGQTATVKTQSAVAPPEGLTPEELQAWAEDFEQGRIDAGEPDSVDVTQAPSRKVYVGSNKFQEDELARSLIDRAIAGEKDPDTVRALNFRRAGVDLPDSLEGPAPSVTPIDWQSGLPKGTFGMPRGSTPVELNPPPSAYFGTSANRPQYVGTDPSSGKPIAQFPDGTFRVMNIQGGDAMGAKPSAQRSVSPTLTTQLQRSKQVLDELASRRTSKWWGQKTKGHEELGAEAAYKQALGAVMAATGATPGLQEAAISIATDPQLSKMTVSELLTSGALDPAEWSEQELVQLDRMLNYTRGALVQ